MMAARDGDGITIADHALPDAHDLAEHGWIERRLIGEDEVWFWTPQAETALDTSALLRSADDRQN